MHDHVTNSTAGFSISLALAAFACGSAPAEVPPPPAFEALGLSDQERAEYAPITFDKLFDALEIAGDDSEAVEMVIKRVNRKTVGWSGVVQSTRIVKQGLEVSEFALNVAPPAQLDSLFPKTFPVLVEAPNDDPISKIDKGTPVVFVARLEFDGLSRRPWVMDARLIEVAGGD